MHCELKQCEHTGLFKNVAPSKLLFAKVHPKTYTIDQNGSVDSAELAETMDNFPFYC